MINLFEKTAHALLVSSFISSVLTCNQYILDHYHNYWNMVVTDSTKTVLYDTISSFKSTCLDIQCTTRNLKTYSLKYADADDADYSEYFGSCPCKIEVRCNSALIVNGDTIQPMTDFIKPEYLGRLGTVNYRNLDIRFDSSVVCNSNQIVFYLFAPNDNDNMEHDTLIVFKR